MRYRYRTPALIGPWRTNPEAAREDALRAAQADRREDGTIAWRASARLETAVAPPAWSVS